MVSFIICRTLSPMNVLILNGTIVAPAATEAHRCTKMNIVQSARPLCMLGNNRDHGGDLKRYTLNFNHIGKAEAA